MRELFLLLDTAIDRDRTVDADRSSDWELHWRGDSAEPLSMGRGQVGRGNMGAHKLDSAAIGSVKQNCNDYQLPSSPSECVVFFRFVGADVSSESGVRKLR